MYYIINSKQVVLFRSRNLSKLKTKVKLINTHSLQGKVTITDTKPTIVKTPTVTVLPYNDPVEN